LIATVVSASRIDLSWTDNSGNEDGFRIESKAGSGGTYASLGTVPAGTTAYSNTGLAPDTTYYYRVCAYNPAYGDSAFAEALGTTVADIALNSLSKPGANTAVVVLGYDYTGSDFVAGQEYVYELGVYYPPNYPSIEFRRPDIGLGNCRLYFAIEDVTRSGPVTTNGGTIDFKWYAPGGTVYSLAQASEIDITSPYTGIPGSSFEGEGRYVVAPTAGDACTVFVKFNRTEVAMASETSIAFLADFFVSHFVAAITAAFATDENPDPDTFVATVAGSNGGTLVLTAYTNPGTGNKTSTYVYSGYDGSGTSYSSVPSMVEATDSAGQGTLTGMIITTKGAHQGWIMANLTVSGQNYAGTWNVGGTTYTHAELLTYLGQ
jgi:hypothetical protein